MYIGKPPVNGFHTKQQISGDGSETTFTLDFTVADETSIIVSDNAVVLEPKVGYSLAIGGTKIVFASAPANGQRTYVQFLGQAVVQNLRDLNGSALILDANGNTTMTADTDDQIDFKLGGTDKVRMSTTALSPSASDGTSLGTSALEWSDLFLADGAVINFGDDQDVSLTHVVDTGLLLSSTDKLQFGDSGTFIHQSSNGVLTIDGEVTIDLNASTAVLVSNDLKLNSDAAVLGLGADNDVTITHVHDTGILINSSRKIQFSDATQFIHGLSDTVLALGATDEIDLTATAIDINGTCDISGQFSLGGTNVTSTAAELNLIDGGTARGTTAVASGDGILINDGGTMRMTNVDTVSTYFSSHNVGGGNIVTTGALDSGSITSGFGTIDTGSSTITTTGAITGGSLTADDVAINGKVITMTGSSGDTFTTTVGTNGATTLTTVDTAAAAANITITADGTAELAGTTVTLNSSGGVTLDADGGTITFADGGSSLGTITSSGYSGTSAVATTVTVTDNESTNENNVLTFVAGADADGGNVGLESDGNLTYNPSTGTLSATNLVVSGTQTITNSVTMNANNAVVFEGATADDHETTLTSIDATGDRTISLPNVSGTLPVLAAASATAITATPAEINLIDGGTSRGTTAVASGDGILTNDGGTMRMTNVDTFDTYFAATTKTLTNKTLTTPVIDTITRTGDFTIDASGDIILDADGAEIKLKDGGTQFGTLYQDNYCLAIDNPIQDYDIKFKGNDGGSGITALTLDMSEAGAATFNSNAYFPDNGNIMMGAAQDLKLYHDGSNSIVRDSGTGSLFLSGSAVAIKNAAVDENMIVCTQDGAVQLYYNNVNKYETTSGGGQVNGDLYATGGNIGLDSGDKLEFSNNAHISFVVNGGEEARLEADGDLHVDGDVVAFSTTISDERLKENIQPIGDALSKVSQLNGVTFTYKADGKESAGLIAQDVEKVLPSAITEKELPLKIDDGNEYKVLQYDQTIGLLVEAIKELKAEIDELKGE